MKRLYKLEVGESVLIHTDEWFFVNTYIVDVNKGIRSFDISCMSDPIVPSMHRYFGKLVSISGVVYNENTEEFSYYIEGCKFPWDIRAFDVDFTRLYNNSIDSYCKSYCIQECSKTCPIYSTIAFINKYRKKLV